MADSKTPDKQEQFTEAMLRAGEDAWCRHNHGEPYDGEIEDIYRSILAVSLPSARGDDWIPTSERVPQPYDTVICVEGVTGYIDSNGDWHRHDYEGKSPPPTHWMPFPAIPSYVNVKGSDGPADS